MMLSLTKEGCASRRAALIEAAQVDLIVVCNPRHIQYLCGMFITPVALSAWGPNALIIDAAGGASTLVVHNNLEGAAASAFVDNVEVWRVYDAATEPGLDAYREGVRQLDARLRGRAGGRVGVEAGWLPHGLEIGGSTLDISEMIAAMRRRKQADELALIRGAIHAVGAGHGAARQAIAAGMTELDVYNVIHATIVSDAGDAVLLMGDFASGERAETGGGPPTRRVLQDGDLMICDVFPVVNGYRGDCTATLCVGGRLSDRQKQVEMALHEALSAGEAMLKPGSRCREVYQSVRGALAKRDLADYFFHHAGHGLGLGHPEAPFFVPGSEETLLAGDVVTLEPGVYGPGFGARIEHNYLITDAGFERLSEHATSFS